MKTAEKLLTFTCSRTFPKAQKRGLITRLRWLINTLTMKIKIIEIKLTAAQYELLNGTPITPEKLLEANLDDIPDGRLNRIAALGEAEFERVRELMRAGAAIVFVREPGEHVQGDGSPSQDSNEAPR